jgi:hypothetical protein
MYADRTEFRDYRQRIGAGVLYAAAIKFECFPYYIQGPMASTEAQLAAILASWHGIEHIVVFINDFDAVVLNMIE